MEMFTLYGPMFLRELTDRSFKIFLDLKFYDIPHTVGQAVVAAQNLGVDILTLHIQGGEKMLTQAVLARNQCAQEKKTRLFGVTVLTSFGEGELPGITQKTDAFAYSLAKLAEQCNLDGIVCSAKELREMKKRFPKLSVICPGIRPHWASKADQQRIATPKEAVANGADFLVIGRPILCAQDPVAATKKILEEIN